MLRPAHPHPCATAQQPAEAKSRVTSLRKSLIATNNLTRKDISCLPGVSMQKDEWSGTQGEGGKKGEGGVEACPMLYACRSFYLIHNTRISIHVSELAALL